MAPESHLVDDERRVSTGRKLLWILAGFFLLLVGFVFIRFFAAPFSSGDLIISKETTYLTEPLTIDGYPDYITALNDLQSEGVTPDNNAAILLLRAVGPAEISQEIRIECFKRLGIPPLSPTDDYFDDWSEYLPQIPAAERPVTPAGDEAAVLALLEEMQEKAQYRPWSREEFSHLAKWLDANQPHLELVVAASKRPRYYTPMLAAGDPPMLIGVLLPMAQEARGLARALVTRAMLRLHEKDYAGAWADLMACHRLGRLIGQGPYLVEALVGFAIEGLAFSGESAFLAEAKLNPEEWAEFRKQFDQLPPRARMAQRLDRGERLSMLDGLVTVALRGPKAFEALTGPGGDNALAGIALRSIDWNIPLKMANEWMDRHVEAAQIEDPKLRAEANARIEADLVALAAEAKEPWGLASALLSRRRASEKAGQVFVALFMPALTSVSQAESRAMTMESLIRIGLALAEYKEEHGEYPVALADLAPKYLASIPADAFNGAPLIYKQRPDGYLLYSIGANALDEGGKTHDENRDDWKIEIPRPPRPKPAPPPAEPNSEPTGESSAPPDGEASPVNGESVPADAAGTTVP